MPLLLINRIMKRRKIMVAAGFCLSFFLGTLMNLLYVPGFEPQHRDHRAQGDEGRVYRENGENQPSQQQQLEPRDAGHGGVSPGTERGATVTTGSLGDLQLQIRERYDEVLRYRRARARGSGRADPVPVRPLERRRLMDLEPGDRGGTWDASRGTGRVEHRRTRYRNPRRDGPRDSAVDSRVPVLGCSSLDAVSGLQYLGSGFTKAVFRAALNGSLSVALKAVDFSGHDMQSCVRRFGSVRDCYRLASCKILKEMALMERLRHNNILKLYGYCYQESNDILDTVTAITELGSPLEMIQLLQTSWEERFRICLSLVRLLHYLAHSPLGSVTLLDFRPRQFVVVTGELKVTDLDDASTEETPCSPFSPADCIMDFPARNFSLPCHRGHCVGINEKRNLYNAYRFFFTYLLPHSAPPALRPLLDRIVNSTGELVWGIDETLAEMEKVLHLYKNGLYLQNNTHTAEYTRLVDTSLPGENYRCWPSYQHDGCLLSVFSVQEAVSVCESHAQCRAFVLTNQTTWTGHQLVHFKTGSASLQAAAGRVTYVRVGS